MNRTRLLYRVGFAGTLLLLLLAAILSVLRVDIEVILALVALALIGVVALGHLRQRVVLADLRRQRLTLTRSFQELRSSLVPPAPVVVDHSSDLAALSQGLASVSSRLGSMSTDLRKARDRIYDAETAGIDAHYAVLSLTQQWDKQNKKHTREHAFLVSQFQQLRTLMEHVPSDTGEYAIIRSLLADADMALPRLGGWALSSNVVVSIARHLRHMDHAATVVELGSGGSSTWLSLAVRQSSHGGQVFSLEHLREFAAQTRRSLDSQGLSGVGTVLDAPLLEQEIGGEKVAWYDSSVLPDTLNSIDLLLVDGPPSNGSPMSRYPAIPLLHERLADGATIVLDDVIRAEEQAVLARWMAEFPQLREVEKLGKAVMLRWQPHSEDA